MPASANWLFSAILLAAALGGPPAWAGKSVPPGVSDNPGGWTESGEASWYGPRHSGRRTSNGEVFDPRKLTAAHPSLPLGSWVRVTVQDTGASIVVKINDREPPHGVRCIDLSRAAAVKLGFANRGVADVTVAEVSGPDTADSVEVAEAPDDAQPVEARHVSARHGRPHRHHAHQ
jgi:rare lipoprotein A